MLADFKDLDLTAKTLAPKFGMAVEAFVALVKLLDENPDLETILVHCVHMRHTHERCPDADHEGWDYAYPPKLSDEDKVAAELEVKVAAMAKDMGLPVDQIRAMLKGK